MTMTFYINVYNILVSFLSFTLLFNSVTFIIRIKITILFWVVILWQPYVSHTHFTTLGDADVVKINNM